MQILPQTDTICEDKRQSPLSAAAIELLQTAGYIGPDALTVQDIAAIQAMIAERRRRRRK